MIRPRRWPLLLLLAGLAATGCRRGGESAPAAACSVLVWNVGAWHPLDRDGDFEADDPKPEAERRAAAGLIARENPDLLVALEVGAGAALESFVSDLALAGYSLPTNRIHAVSSEEAGGLLVASRFPLEGAASSPAVYRIEDSGELRARPWVEARVTPPAGPAFVLVAAHLREQHPFAKGQEYEVRRNESRLLGQRIAQLRRAETNLLVAGTFNDDPETPVLRQVAAWRGEASVAPVRLLDASGAAWTVEVPGLDQYRRRDFLMVSPALRDHLLPSEGRVLDLPSPAPSPHRPLRLAIVAGPGVRGH